jgi:hypothetical protein
MTQASRSELDFIELWAVSASVVDMKDCFRADYFVGALECEAEPPEIAEGTPASAGDGPVEQLEAIGLRDWLQPGERSTAATSSTL